MTGIRKCLRHPPICGLQYSYSSVDLQWDASTDNVGVIEYDVYKGDTLAGTTTDTSYTARSLSAGTDYSFYVFAKDAAGNISPHSNIVKVSTLSDYALSTEAVGRDCFKSGNLIYTILNDTDVIVKAADTSISGHVSIPGSLVVMIEDYRKVYKVTEIAHDGFYDCKALTGIDITTCVTTIGETAFYGCSSLEDVYVHWMIHRIL